MMNIKIIRSLLISLIAGLSTLIGGFTIFFKIKNKEKFLSFALSFSLSVMVCISIFDLIPSSFMTLLNNYSLIYSILITILILVLSYITMYLINKKIAILECSGGSLYKLGILSVVVLILHNFPEGIATFITSYNDLYLGINLSLAIMMHNIPEGITIAIPIYYSTNKKNKALLYTFISGISEPIGAIVAYIFLKNYINTLTIGYILIFVAGMMIYISINNIYSEITKYNKKPQINMGLILGIILVIINELLF